MKNIVFVLGEYYPDFSAVGKCAYRVAELLARDNNVTVICLKSDLSQPDKEVFNNQSIIRMSTDEYNKRHKYILKTNNTNGFTKIFYKLLFNLVRINVALKLFMSKATISTEKVNAFYQGLNQISNIDIIIPCCFPMESVVASLRFVDNNSDVKVAPYLFDPFTESLSLHRLKLNKIIKRKNHLKLEKEMLKKSEKVIVMKHLENHFKNNFNYDNKLIVADHPLLTNKCNGNNFDKTIKIVYTGIFHNKVRHPLPFLKFMNKSLNSLDAVLNLYAYGNCDNIIRDYTNKNNKIIFHGKVNSEVAEAALVENNILVSIGNKDNTQVPSKLIEYMSYGKPIVHFYTNPQDDCINILNNYPLGLTINLCDINEINQQNFIAFCKKNKHSYLLFNQVLEKRGERLLPIFTANTIKSL